MTNHLSPITHNRNRSSFTLIELLVTLAIVAILSVVVIVTLNPAELLKQARDSNRLSDLATINTALNLFSTDVIGGFMGTSTVVYVSLPSTTSTCSNLGLPTLPTGYTYNCVTSQNLRNTNGTGWIPVNFNRISSNSPISQLPIDPTNTTSTGSYYAYIAGGSWKLQSQLESQKYQTSAQNDGGVAIGKFEIGNNMTIAPFLDGLLGWWKFDEGVGTSTVDSSGWGFNGSFGGTTSWLSGAGCRIGSCLNFDGSGKMLASVGSSYAFTDTKFTMMAWVNNKVSTNGHIICKDFDFDFRFIYGGDIGAQVVIVQNSNNTNTGLAALNSWYHLVATYDGANIKVYSNGVLFQTLPYVSAIPNNNANIAIGGGTVNNDYLLQGVVDDVRVYKRVLSAGEILALYNASK